MMLRVPALFALLILQVSDCIHARPLGLALELTTPGATIVEASTKNTNSASGSGSTSLVYGTVVAFGASYTDNAHPRSSAYAGSLRNYFPYSQYGGRYTNGQVAVEYLAANPGNPGGSTAVLQDYAYGGSEIDNSLVYNVYPATKDQIQQYISDVTSKSITLTSSVLYYYNSGINPLTAIWLDAISAGLSSSAIATAKGKVTANTNAIASQLRGLEANAGVKGSLTRADYLIVGIPPLELLPTFVYQAGGSQAALDLLKTLEVQFNSEVSSFAATFNNEVGGRAIWFDLSALWQSFLNSPSTYGIDSSVINTPCYNSGTGNVCGNPASYVYFDSLHPVTTIHAQIAKKMVTALRS
ncbi:hypothetical protein T439DRAFT_305693 [Meredithblackwellia eburnea MCA 4105]